MSLRPTRTWHPNPSLAELKLFAWPFYLEVIIKLGVVHFDFEVVSSAMEMERGVRGARKQFNAMENERISQTSTDSRTVAKGDSQRGEGRGVKTVEEWQPLCCAMLLAPFGCI